MDDLGDKLILRVHRQNDNPGLRVIFLDHPCRLDSVEERHGNVHHNNVRREFFRIRDRLLSVFGLSDDLDVGLIVQE